MYIYEKVRLCGGWLALPLCVSATIQSHRVVGALMQRLFANVAESSRVGESREGREII